MSNKYWTDKTDYVDTIYASDFNRVFDSTNSSLPIHKLNIYQPVQNKIKTVQFYH